MLTSKKIAIFSAIIAFVFTTVTYAGNLESGFRGKTWGTKLGDFAKQGEIDWNNSVTTTGTSIILLNNDNKSLGDAKLKNVMYLFQSINNEDIFVAVVLESDSSQTQTLYNTLSSMLKAKGTLYNNGNNAKWENIDKTTIILESKPNNIVTVSIIPVKYQNNQSGGGL